uniref:Uncharacterized protein n=1 Tax=Arundo donax TaxID=35708 RepID=A0A0A8YB53_ARUDO
MTVPDTSQNRFLESKLKE